jgi:cellulose synthase/poly-beta-1,6-N-acetylglucosamine synthase-like glycosyltransferase
MRETVLFLVFLPAFLAVYAYLVYPALLWILASRSKVSGQERWPADPSVSVVVPAYNEEREIAGALDALLAQTYPSDLLQVLVVSDASSDSTDEIVRSYAPRVELLRMPERAGKTRAENVAANSLRGEIIVNTDASIRLHPSAVEKLVRSLADPSTGVASGRDVSVSRRGAANETEAAYVGYEMWVRALETRSGGIVGASGCCYAIRAQLHNIPLRDDLSRDFCSALTAREHGLRAVSVDEAICFVPRTESLHREYARKVRTIHRGMATLVARRHMLNPVRYGLFAWKLFSHKICRWLVPLTAPAALLGLAHLALSAPAARTALVAVAAVTMLALGGVLWRGRTRIPAAIAVIAFAAAANLAVLHGFWRALGGRGDRLWEPTRRSL